MTLKLLFYIATLREKERSMKVLTGYVSISEESFLLGLSSVPWTIGLTVFRPLILFNPSGRKWGASYKRLTENTSNVKSCAKLHRNRKIDGKTMSKEGVMSAFTKICSQSSKEVSAEAINSA